MRSIGSLISFVTILAAITVLVVIVVAPILIEGEIAIRAIFVSFFSLVVVIHKYMVQVRSLDQRRRRCGLSSRLRCHRGYVEV